ncbi:hypothetical protein DL240_10190 [Lujinxingia litoralis]|uniref:Outer membrane protein beta-barrel domain-containing protein n=1 Tax=Lujinxingia litoralis TaxID=2211119 RepID=A0A328C9A0_9DELT|nr:hypothetical protein [Lujinxingia litoralis]RAL22213.1 hypothetical protein DL240_10190 [Lujinxingia litoralis]
MRKGGAWWVALTLMVVASLLMPREVRSEEVAWEPTSREQQGKEERAEVRESPRPLGLGVLVRGGMAAYRSQGCACFDRSTWQAGLGVRGYLGAHFSVELSLHYGMMLLGGNFPLNGWEAAARWEFLPEAAVWYRGLYARAGYTSMSVMGMRQASLPGAAGAVGLGFELTPMLRVETEFGARRLFGDMGHWQFGAQLGLATRF